MPLVHHGQPGTYAYETRAQAERRVLIQQQSLQAERKRFEGAATVRTLQPGTTFTLLEHPEHDSGLAQGSDDEARFVVLGVVHRARNNLSADVQAGLQHLLGSVVRPGQQAATANASDEPLYEARFGAQLFRVHSTKRECGCAISPTSSSRPFFTTTCSCWQTDRDRKTESKW